MPANDSPLWPILKVTLRSGVLLAGLLLFYRSGLAEADVKTMLLCILADAGITTLSEKMRGKE